MNKIGSGIWLAAAVTPDRFQDYQETHPLGARWRPVSGDSVEIEWYIPASVFGVGIMLAVMTQDSLSGRVARASDVIPGGPWVPINGRSISCDAGA